MRDTYDFSDSTSNPYTTHIDAKKSKQQKVMPIDWSETTPQTNPHIASPEGPSPLVAEGIKPK